MPVGKVSIQDLKDRLVDANRVCPKGSEWVHIKSGKKYVIKMCVLNESDKCVLVIYGDNEVQWAREINEFVKRFMIGN